MRHDLLVCLVLILVTTAVFWQVRNHDFINFDDPGYITANQHVLDGLTSENVRWAFSAIKESNWHPLTWLSHMLDCQLYGVKSGPHHLTNVLFHIINTVMLFLVLKRMTGATWRSAFVAALFAFHPLHVESVAWLAERKDVLSTFFWMLTMWAYVRYVEKPQPPRYLLSLLFFAVGLMAKPMLVTLPFVLLLLDLWPLGRIQIVQSNVAKKQKSRKSPKISNQSSIALRLVGEKIPFLVLAAASSIVTFIVQQKGGAIASSDLVPIKLRIANALIVYVRYIQKMIWPAGLAVFYPRPETWPIWQVAGSGLVLISISTLAVWMVRRYPYLTVGWLWYLGTLVPVIGIVQVGRQAMADRYTYVPLIGLFILITWGGVSIVSKWRHQKFVLVLSAAIVISVLLTGTWFQLQYWRNSITLYRHTLNVTIKNYLAHYNLGVALENQGQIGEAMDHYSEAVRIKPDYVEAHNNLGIALLHQRQIKDAIAHFSQVINLSPNNAEVHNNLGLALENQGQMEEAMTHYSEALRIKPDLAQAHFNIANLLVKQGQIDKATEHLFEAVRIKPDMTAAHYNLGVVLLRQGKPRDGIGHLHAALRLKPDWPLVLNKLAWIMSTHEDPQFRNGVEAIQLAQKACEKTGYKNPVFLETLAAAYAETGRFDNALQTAQRALEVAATLGQREVIERVKYQMDLYKNGRPFREQ